MVGSSGAFFDSSGGFLEYRGQSLVLSSSTSAMAGTNVGFSRQSSAIPEAISLWKRWKSSWQNVWRSKQRAGLSPAEYLARSDCDYHAKEPQWHSWSLLGLWWKTKVKETSDRFLHGAFSKLKMGRFDHIPYWLQNILKKDIKIEMAHYLVTNFLSTAFPRLVVGWLSVLHVLL